MNGLTSYDIREVNLSDVIKVDVNYSTNETCAEARQKFISQFGPVEAMVLTSSYELLLHPENYDALVASGVEKAVAVVLNTPEYANRHIRNLFGVIPGTFAGKAEWLVENQPYYKEGGYGYSLRMEETVEDEDKSLKKYLGSFIGYSHASVQKLFDIYHSKTGAALLSQMDAGDCSLNRAYKICHSAKPEEKALKSLKDHSCVTVLGGNTKGLKLSDEEKGRLATMFAGVTKEVSEQLSLPVVPAAFNLRPNTDRKGKLESYSMTYKSPAFNFTGIIQQNEKEVQNETK